MGNSRRRCVRSDASQYEHKRDMNWAVYMGLFQICWGYVSGKDYQNRMNSDKDITKIKSDVF